MPLSTHLVFRGDCEAAFRFYAQAFDGTLGPMLTYGDSPAARDVPTDWRDKIVHASMDIGGMHVSGADVLPERYARPQGFYLLFTARTAAEAERVFRLLAEGGEVRMPLQPTFWSPAFGVVVDRFGVPWETSAEHA